MMLQADVILFDLDGTLVDTAPDLHRATNHVLASIGRGRVSLNQVHHMVGRGAKVLIKRGLDATGGPCDIPVEELLGRFLDFYADNIAVDSRPFDGMPDMLDELMRSGYLLGLCTNKPERLARELLQALDMEHYFKAITGGDSFAFRKPDPRHLSETARLIGPHTPGRIVMVGDSAADIDAAKALGATSIAVTFGYTDIPAEALGADAVARSAAEISAILRPPKRGLTTA